MTTLEALDAILANDAVFYGVALFCVLGALLFEIRNNEKRKRNG